MSHDVRIVSEGAFSRPLMVVLRELVDQNKTSQSRALMISSCLFIDDCSEARALVRKYQIKGNP